MKTAAETNVLVDIFLADQHHGPISLERLQDGRLRGSVIICNVVYAVLVHGFQDRASLDSTLDDMGIIVATIGNDVAFEAGVRWSRYRLAGGPRNRILADFLIGSHALLSADSFLTRDDGFYRTYFPELHTPIDAT